jgi:hypothetical protein
VIIEEPDAPPSNAPEESLAPSEQESAPESAVEPLEPRLRLIEPEQDLGVHWSVPRRSRE